MKTYKKDTARNIMVISHLWKNNAVFENYCNGIKANSNNYCFVDYIDLYLQAGKKMFEKRIEDMVMEKKINYIFFILGSSDLTFDIHFIEKLSKMSFITMNFFDTEYYFDSVDKYYAQAADLVLLSDYMSKFRYELLNINALGTFALFDKNLYSTCDGLEKNIDVTFVGNILNGNRKKYIEYLAGNGIKIEPYGEGTSNGYVNFIEMIDIFRTSKINLNFTGTNNNSTLFGLNINNRIRQCKGRPIEIALCGGFVLSEYAPGMENMFEIGKEIDVFHTREELLEKIRYYLVNEKEREGIAKRGHERALRDYDAETAFAKIFNNIDRYVKKDPNIYLDDDFIKNYATFRFFYIGLCLLNKKYKNMFKEFCILFKYRRINYRNACKYLRYSVSVFFYRHKKIKNILKRVLLRNSHDVPSKAELTT